MKRILVADDDGSIRLYLMEVLQREYDVVCVANGKQLCTLLNQCEDEFDLVIADVHMPAWGTDRLDPTKAIQGCVFSADLKLQGCRLPVIYISGDTGREFALHKPLREDVLKAAIADALMPAS
ncbi:MAG: response regulator [Planctomycetota bacterium]|jgi:CheY-like chemotaxis protein